MGKLKVAIFGMGNRGKTYSEWSLGHPSEMEVVQVVDSNPTALEYAKGLFHLSDDALFLSFEDWLKAPKVADAVFNCFMDQYHYATTLPLFSRGYDVLLEKPITVHPDELLELMNESKKYGRKFGVCHVLRYSPFYRKAKEVLLSGEIGKLVALEMAEHVYIPHMLASYVRGKWKSEAECGSPMIMAKCCHDTDLMCWFNEGSRPTFVSSFGSRSIFTAANKPKDATDRCMSCPHMKECQYSCYFNLELTHMDPIIFQSVVPGKQWNEVTREEKIKVFSEHPSLGKCVFDPPYDIVDHQVLQATFENGVTASLNMIGGTSYPCRTFHLLATSGEIFGVLESNKITVRKYQKDKFWRDTIEYDLGDVAEGHSGGDLKLVEEFVDYLNYGKKSISLTTVEESIDGHLLCIAGDISDKQRKVVEILDNREFRIR